MPPSPSAAPGSYTSSPVEKIATLSRRKTASPVRPTEAARPISCGLSARPALRMVVPAAMSSPALRRLAPRLIPGGMTTASPSARQSSCISTVSGPGGMGAPVKMRTASPRRAGRPSGCPAAARPVHGSRVSAPASRSSKKTA